MRRRQSGGASTDAQVSVRRVKRCAVEHWHVSLAVSKEVYLQTFLENIKTQYTATPGMQPDKIGPTVGQNSGSICVVPAYFAIDR